MPDSKRFNKTDKRPYSGKYPIKNPKKYRGDFKKIIYRSSWELRFMVYCDKHPAVLEWSSEEIIIPYISPKDNDYHRYYPDFWIKVQTKEGVKEFLIEVKPHAQTLPPKKRKKTRRFIAEQLTYEVNQAKWAAAKVYCSKKNMEFKVLTEKHLT